MKILFTTYSGMGLGGAEISMSLLANGLRKRGHEVVIASSGDYEGGVKFKKFGKIPFYSIHNQYLSKFFSKIIKEKNIDLIHAHDRLTSIAAIRAAKKHNIPVCLHFRDYWFACPRSSCLTPSYAEYNQCSYFTILTKFPKSRILWDMNKWRYIKSKWKELDTANIKFANSGVVKRRLEMCGINKNVKIVPILRDFENEKGGNGKWLKEKYHLKEIVITFIGSLDYHKGIMNMVKIMPEILRKYEASFLVVGDGPLLNEIRKSNAILTGRLDKEKVRDVYEISDIILLPSIWQEPLSGILLEAAANNKAVISSNTGGSPDILPNELMLDPRDLNKWKERIEELIKNKNVRNKLGEKWGKIAREKYDVKIIAEKIEKEYENVRHSRV